MQERTRIVLLPALAAWVLLGCPSSSPTSADARDARQPDGPAAADHSGDRQAPDRPRIDAAGGPRWCPLTGIPSSEDLYGAWSDGPGTLFAVGTKGTVLRYDGAWSKLGYTYGNDLTAVWGRSASDVFAVGGTTSVYHDNGAGWSAITSVTDVFRLNAVWGDSSAVFVAGFPPAATFVYWSDGSQWQSKNVSSLTGYDVKALSGWYYPDLKAHFLYAAGCVWKETPPAIGWGLTSASTTWKFTELSGLGCLRGLWATSDAVQVFTVGDGGAILRSVTGASNTAKMFPDFKPMVSPTTQSLMAVWGSSEKDVVAAGEQGALLRFDGTTWASVSSGTSVTLRAVTGSSATDIFAVGDAGTVLHFDGKTAGCP
jgi:hypothetical protein